MKPLHVKFIDGGEQAKPIILHALSKDYDVQESDAPYVVFFGDDKKAKHKQFQKCLKIYMAVEYKYPNFNQCDYALSYLNLSTQKNLRLPFYTWEDRGEDLIKGENEWKKIIHEKNKFCAFIVSNVNPNRTWKRISFFHKLSKYKTVDSGGGALNNIGYRVDKKLEFYKPYKFVMAIENQMSRKYTTEKIAHAMMSRCIPVYWGNPDIVEEFNPKSFINLHDFKNDAEAINHIIQIDQNQALLEQYMKEPFFYNNQLNEWFDIQRLRNFLVKAIESPRVNRELWGYLPFRLLEIKKNIQPYYEKIENAVKSSMK
jgi:hypothetical protein